MLYISRYAGYANYAIMDTDDGLETVVVPYAVKQTVMEFGVMVNGVVVGPSGVEDILTYQNPEMATVEQTKLSLLRGVDIVTCGDIITGIRWRPELLDKPLKIRLSHFGRVVGERVLYGNKEYQPHKMTLIVDDRLEICDNSFTANGFGRAYEILGPDGIGVKFDLRELTDELKAQAVYNALVPRYMNQSKFQSIADFIIDDSTRRAMKIRSRLQGR